MTMILVESSTGVRMVHFIQVYLANHMKDLISFIYSNLFRSHGNGKIKFFTDNGLNYKFQEGTWIRL